MAEEQASRPPGRAPLSPEQQFRVDTGATYKTMMQARAIAALRVHARAFPRGCARALGTAAQTLIRDSVEQSEVVLFCKTTCPFCLRSKQTLASMSVPYEALELDTMDQGADIQAELLTMTGQRTVPNIFVKGEHLGGNDDLQEAAQSGRLAELLGKK